MRRHLVEVQIQRFSVIASMIAWFEPPLTDLCCHMSGQAHSGQLLRQNDRLTEQLRKAEIVIDVQKRLYDSAVTNFAVGSLPV
jgi:hypothetical protein